MNERKSKATHLGARELKRGHAARLPGHFSLSLSLSLSHTHTHIHTHTHLGARELKCGHVARLPGGLDELIEALLLNVLIKLYQIKSIEMMMIDEK